MGWGNIVKANLPPSLQVMLNQLKKIIAHPEYNKDDLLRNLGSNFKIELFQRLIEEVENNDTIYLSFYHNLIIEHTNIRSYEVFIYEVNEILEKYYRKIVSSRSRKFLESVAETFGVRLSFGDNLLVEVVFEHRGLRFTLHPGGLRIHIPGSKVGITICVVDDNNLPRGDFYASMLGLIIAKPKELDVVNFGIELGIIMLRYKDYPWVKATLSLPLIGIFTPFEVDNGENYVFEDMLGYLRRDKQNGLARVALIEIERALKDSFFSTRGFF